MKTITALFLILVTSITFAKEIKPVGYDWKVLRVLDGDTVEVEAPYLPAPLKPVLKVRVLGVDTPEKNPRAKCPQEHEKALLATKLTKDAIANAKVIKVYITEWDKYGGRILGDLVIDGKQLSTRLIEAGLAREYYGEAKQSWCN
jgi:endonuclease YncB( thermonuclease family)